MQLFKNKVKQSYSIILIIMSAGFLVFPFLFTKSLIIGSDAIFHYNRFYDTSMQLKTGNYHYFISMFGFQQSARIVNPFYGPLMAYVQGFILWLSGSWYHYQIISNFLIYSIAGISLYSLLRSVKVNKRVSVTLAIIYMTTFSIHYWTFKQAFTSWGTALFPLGLLPLHDMIQQKKIHWKQLAIVVALLFQTHMLSSFFLVLIYIPFFLYALFKSNEKNKLVLDLIKAVALFGLLTANIWSAYYLLYSGNHIHAPFVNRHMYLNTINLRSRNWLFYPFYLWLLMIFQWFLLLKNWGKLSSLTKGASLISLIFLFCSTSLFPWKYLIQHENKFAELIQFPFRFFAPYTVLFLFSFGLILKDIPFSKRNKKIPYLQILACAGLIQIFSSVSSSLNDWNTVSFQSRQALHTFIEPVDDETIYSSFYQEDLHDSLHYWQKSTPDYVPIIQKTTNNKYRLYEEFILERNDKFSKKVENGQLMVSWFSDSTNLLDIPIFKYKNTQLQLNGETLNNKKVKLSEIGTVIVQPQMGQNILAVSYLVPNYFLWTLWIMLFSWLYLVIEPIFKWIKNRKFLGEIE